MMNAMPKKNAMPRTPAPRPDVRVEVKQTRLDGAIDYSVRVSQPDGAGISNADVRLRRVMTDGTLVEARLEPAAEPGMYHSLLAFSARGATSVRQPSRTPGAVRASFRDSTRWCSSVERDLDSSRQNLRIGLSELPL